MARPLVESRKSNVLDKYGRKLSFALVDVPLIPFSLIVCEKIPLSLFSFLSISS